MQTYIHKYIHLIESMPTYMHTSILTTQAGGGGGGGKASSGHANGKAKVCVVAHMAGQHRVNFTLFRRDRFQKVGPWVCGVVVGGGAVSRWCLR